MKEKVIVCYSGGLDSTTLGYLHASQGYDVTLATFDDGPYNDPASPSFDPKLPPDMEPFFVMAPWYQEMFCRLNGWESVVMRFPQLNLITHRGEADTPSALFAEGLGLDFYVGFKAMMVMNLLALGASRGAVAVSMGHMPGFNDQYKDELPEHLLKVRALMVDLYGSRVAIPQLWHPYYAKEYLTKESVIQLAIKLGVPLERTYSCRAGTLIRTDFGGWVHCGWCEACLERKRAFKALGVEDPASYEV